MSVLNDEELEALAEASRVERPVLDLVLYVAGSNVDSLTALRNLRAALALVSERTTVNVIDVLHEPMEAQRSQVLLTPTLVRRLEGVAFRIIGNLHDRVIIEAFLLGYGAL